MLKLVPGRCVRSGSFSEWMNGSFPFGSADDALCQKWQKCNIASKFTFSSVLLLLLLLPFILRVARSASSLFNSPVLPL